MKDGLLASSDVIHYESGGTLITSVAGKQALRGWRDRNSNLMGRYTVPPSPRLHRSL